MTEQESSQIVIKMRNEHEKLSAQVIALINIRDHIQAKITELQEQQSELKQNAIEQLEALSEAATEAE